MLEENERNKRR